MSQYRNNPKRNYGRGGRNYRNRKPQNTGRGLKKENIHPSKFVQAAKPQGDDEYVSKHKFSDFGLNHQLQSNLAARKFLSPSAIQDQVIPPAVSGRDVIGIANTGTGKTMAFALPLINTLMNDPSTRAIIITPTRELAAQVLDECRTLTDQSGIWWALLIGGSSMGHQIRDMSRRPNLIVGTPGRIKDHIERGSLPIHNYNMVVLDEVDRMLDMGFVNDMRKILGGMPKERQSFFFSATIDNRVREIINQFAINPIEVSVRSGNTSDNVEQNIVHYHNDEHKLETLGNLLKDSDVSKVLIFDETRGRVERLSKKLNLLGIRSDSIHGGRSQGQRKRALQNFKNSQTGVLVATDVAARGIDVSDITHVINYTTPQTYDDYIHRVGRAGRAGRKGYALTFLAHS